MPTPKNKSSTKKAPRRLPAARQVVLRVELRHSTPRIWRRIRVPEAFTLEQLHRVLQLSFAWLDYHLYHFEIGSRRFERPETEAEGENAAETTLAEVALTAEAHFVYRYDFGDHWEHDLTVEEFLPMPDPHRFDWSPRVLGGERAGPPEDVGGIPGYEEFLIALRDPRHPEHAERVAWAPPGFDPERFDSLAADHALTLASAWGAI